MSSFWLWFSTGIAHITDLNGYDHILFISLLAIAYTFRDWKKLLILVSAFTIGHSVSLALSVFDVVYIPAPIIELLIAMSILITALFRLVNFRNSSGKHVPWLYLLVTIFGLIHGMGFSFLLKAMLGKEEVVVLPLLYFNLGLEVGQVAIVLLVLLINLLVIKLMKVPVNIYRLLADSFVLMLALKMTVERIMILINSNS